MSAMQKPETSDSGVESAQRVKPAVQAKPDVDSPEATAAEIVADILMTLGEEADAG